VVEQAAGRRDEDVTALRGEVALLRRDLRGCEGGNVWVCAEPLTFVPPTTCCTPISPPKFFSSIAASFWKCKR
jgi:hypothetical protein